MTSDRIRQSESAAKAKPVVIDKHENILMVQLSARPVNIYCWTNRNSNYCHLTCLSDVLSNTLFLDLTIHAIGPFVIHSIARLFVRPNDLVYYCFYYCSGASSLRTLIGFPNGKVRPRHSPW